MRRGAHVNGPAAGGSSDVGSPDRPVVDGGGTAVFVGTDVYNNLELARLREERLRRLARDGAAGLHLAYQGEQPPRWWARWLVRPPRVAGAAATSRAGVAAPIKP
jgi:hypothetical protein